MTWLKVSRRVPGLNKEPEFPSLEALLDAEAEKVADGFHHARWIVPLVMSVVGISVFVPLTVAINPLFGIGTGGMILVGCILGGIFHLIARGIPESRITLQKRSKSLAGRMVRLRNLLGFEPALAPSVGRVLDEAARLYYSVCGAQSNSPRRNTTIISQSRLRSEAAMEAAMAQMLELAEPDSAAAQEVKLSQGWAMPLLKEMRALSDAVQRQEQQDAVGEGDTANRQALAALRSARSDIEGIEEALKELQTEQR